MLISSTRQRLLKGSIPVLRSCQRFNHTEPINEPLISNDDPVHKVDFRIGKIVQIEQHAEATHLFVEQGKKNIQGF